MRPGYRIAVIPGDGIGVEVIEAGLAILEAIAPSNDTFTTTRFPWGSDYWREHGVFMPGDGLETLGDFDAIYFGAIGWPGVPDHLSLWGLRLAIVQGLDQGVNVRPARLLPGTRSPLAGRSSSDIDFLVIRENSEGEYAGTGGHAHRGRRDEIAIQTSVYTRPAIERVARYAFEAARSRPARRVASVTKSNASQYASVLWDEVVAEVAGEYTDVAFESLLVDAAAARFVLAPQTLDVVVASNLHADILSDLTGALAGSLGVAPSANLNVAGEHPSMFEPVHGSAPDIAGQGKANPIGAVLSPAMMLDHLGETSAAASVREAVDTVSAVGVLTPDLGGTASTAEVTDAVISALRR